MEIVRYIVIVDPLRLEGIVAALKALQLDVSLTEVPDSGKGAVDANCVVCKTLLSARESLRALDITNSINQIEGVKRVIPMHGGSEKDHRPLKNHPLWAIILSSVITFFVIYTAVIDIKPNLATEELFRLAILPTILTALTQALFKFFPTERTV